MGPLIKVIQSHTILLPINNSQSKTISNSLKTYNHTYRCKKYISNVRDKHIRCCQYSIQVTSQNSSLISEIAKRQVAFKQFLGSMLTKTCGSWSQRNDFSFIVFWNRATCELIFGDWHDWFDKSIPSSNNKSVSRFMVLQTCQAMHTKNKLHQYGKEMHVHRTFSSHIFHWVIFRK